MNDQIKVDRDRRTITINVDNNQLIKNLRMALQELEAAQEATVTAYQELVSQWEGNTPPPLKGAEESVQFFKHLTYIQKGITGLRDFLSEVQPRLF